MFRYADQGCYLDYTLCGNARQTFVNISRILEFSPRRKVCTNDGTIFELPYWGKKLLEVKLSKTELQRVADQTARYSGSDLYKLCKE